MKPTPLHKLVAVLAAGVLAVGVTVWLTYPKRTVSLAATANPSYMHCPKCGRETRYEEENVDKECPECGSEKGMVPTAESVKAAGGGGTGPSPYTTMAVAVLAELIVVMAAVLLVARSFRPAGEVAYLLTRCPKCGQRLRFKESLVGKPGACRRCKKAFLFPADATPEAEELARARKEAEAEEAEDDEDGDDDQ